MTYDEFINQYQPLESRKYQQFYQYQFYQYQQTIAKKRWSTIPPMSTEIAASAKHRWSTITLFL
jgi:hypothetical protein